MSSKKIAFLGAGNMGCSIISGLLAQGYPKDALRATVRTPANIRKIAEQYGILAGDNNAEAASWADIVVLGAKPQGLQALCGSVVDALSHKPLIISIAAGIHCASIDAWLGTPSMIVRAMPNTPALVRTGATGLFANPRVNAVQKQSAENILAAVGLAIWVEKESQIDVVTAISGSGPAYYFLFMEAMIDAGIALGLDADSAAALTLQTALGAATLAQARDSDVQTLRQQVTSPGGTTEQAILSFERDGLRTLVASAMQSCTLRAQTLAAEFGKPLPTPEYKTKDTP